MKYNSKQGERLMAIKGYHIISLEANDIYEKEQENGVEKGYILPPKNDREIFSLFKNVLFLFLIDLLVFF